MATRTAGGTFETASFAWSRGRFTLTGTWAGANGAGPVVLVATVGGERRRITAEADRVAEDGPRWGARFTSEEPPDAGGEFALEVAGREIALPAPEVNDAETGRFARPPQPGPPPATAAADPPPPTAMPVGWKPEQATDSAGTEAPVENTVAREAPTEEIVRDAVVDDEQAPVSMAEEIQQLNALLAELRTERGKIESAQRRLAQERVQAERVEERLASTAATRRAVPAPRPLPPRLTTQNDPPEAVDYTPAYWVGAFAVFLFFIVLIWVF